MVRSFRTYAEHMQFATSILFESLFPSGRWAFNFLQLASVCCSLLLLDACRCPAVYGSSTLPASLCALLWCDLKVEESASASWCSSLRSRHWQIVLLTVCCLTRSWPKYFYIWRNSFQVWARSCFWMYACKVEANVVLQGEVQIAA